MKVLIRLGMLTIPTRMPALTYNYDALLVGWTTIEEGPTTDYWSTQRTRTFSDEPVSDTEFIVD